MHVSRCSNLRLLILVTMTPFLMGSVGLNSNSEERILAAHNREREQMSVPSLEWDDELATGAAAWARHLSKTGRFEHSPDRPGEEPQGENIWGGTTGYYPVEYMVKRWISEKAYYKPGVFPRNSLSGRVEDVSHYTQLIWRRTTRVGCAISAGGEEEILVCRYSTAGNVIGQPTT